MNLLHNLTLGFGIAVTPMNFLYCLVGATLGTLVGVLPGLNPILAITMLLPLTFKLPATGALIMLSGIYYGAHHAGSTTAIMLNMPGEPSSLVICLDGHPMARNGRAGPALCISALGSFFAGCVCVLLIALFSPPLARAALAFEAPEYTAAVVLALVAVSSLSSRSLTTTLGMAVIGLLIGTIGTDVNTGVERFTFGFDQLADGIDFVAVAVGLFAIAEIAWRLGGPDLRPQIDGRVRGLLPTRADLAASWKPILRGTALGGAFGILPGTGPLISSFASYALEKKLSGEPDTLRSGCDRGRRRARGRQQRRRLHPFHSDADAGYSRRRNDGSDVGCADDPGHSAGPQILTQHPDLFWGLVASMWIGNLMLLVLNLPLVGIWIRLLTIPYRLLYPVILTLCCVGVYSIANSAFFIAVAAVMGAVGYVFRRLDCPPAPLLLGLVLGPVLEENLRRALLISRGDPMVFVQRPISLALLLLAMVLLVVFALQPLPLSGRGKAPGT